MVTRSRRKSSLRLTETEESSTGKLEESKGNKRAQIGKDAKEEEDFEGIRDMFANFIELLNGKGGETSSMRGRRGSQKKGETNRESEQGNMGERHLKRVKRETRKSRGGRKAKEESSKRGPKVPDLEPIKEEVKKENETNGRPSSVIKSPSTEKRKRSTKEDMEISKEEPPVPKAEEKMEAEPEKPQENRNGKIPELAPVWERLLYYWRVSVIREICGNTNGQKRLP